MKIYSVSLSIVLLVFTSPLFAATTFGATSMPTFQPKANTAAVVQIEHARFTILTPRVIRMEWSETGEFEDKGSLVFVHRNLPIPIFTREDKDGWVEISTGALRLFYQPSDKGFTVDTLRVEFKVGKQDHTWNVGMANTANLLGTIGSLDSTDGSDWLEGERRVPIVLEPGLLSREGWTVIDDSFSPLFDHSEWPWVIKRTRQPGDRDLYFFGYGLNYKAALGDFVKIAGPIPLPPRFAFGYWHSRWWPYTEVELRDIINYFKSLDMPISVLLMDMEWHQTALPQFFHESERVKDQFSEDAGWTGFTWDHNFYFDPPAFLKWAHAQNLKISLNLHPASGIQPHEEQYEAMAHSMGADPAKGEPIPFDIVNKKWANNFLDLIIHPLEKNGVDFWWLDWQAWSATNVDGANPIFYLNYVFFSDMARQGHKRPLIYHRWGGLGNHRYPIGFSGDTTISWATLAYQPYFTANAANVGFGFWGHDIGGFRGSKENDPELLTRWFQFGVFSPILKTHATNTPEIKRNPWEYPFETFVRLRRLLHLRYELLPYIYTAARAAFDTGISISRPMYYDHPDEELAYMKPTQYMFGDDMLVSPVVDAMSKEALYSMRETWLPKGRWYEWASGSVIEGGKLVSRSFTLDEVPVYLKEGAIIPMQPRDQHKAGLPGAALILAVFPGQYGETTVYEDEGDTDGYRNNERTITRVQFKRMEDSIRVTIDAAEGHYPGMPVRRSYQLKLVRTLPPVSVTINGQPVSFSTESVANTWHYDGPELTTWITIPEFSVREKVEVEISLPAVGDKLLDGKVALMNHLHRFATFLGGQRNFRRQDIWNDAIHPSGIVIRAAQTGLRLSNRPGCAIEELKTLESVVPQIIRMLTAVSKDQPAFEPYLKLLKVSASGSDFSPENDGNLKRE